MPKVMRLMYLPGRIQMQDSRVSCKVKTYCSHAIQNMALVLKILLLQKNKMSWMRDLGSLGQSTKFLGNSKRFALPILALLTVALAAQATEPD